MCPPHLSSPQSSGNQGRATAHPHGGQIFLELPSQVPGRPEEGHVASVEGEAGEIQIQRRAGYRSWSGQPLPHASRRPWPPLQSSPQQEFGAFSFSGVLICFESCSSKSSSTCGFRWLLCLPLPPCFLGPPEPGLNLEGSELFTWDQPGCTSGLASMGSTERGFWFLGRLCRHPLE